MPVTYEWVVETLDEHGDIQDCSQWSKLADALADKARTPGRTDLCLVRDVFHPIDADLEDRQWAYLSDGAIPVRFDGGAKVPKRYLDEARKHGYSKAD